MSDDEYGESGFDEFDEENEVPEENGADHDYDAPVSKSPLGKHQEISSPNSPLISSAPAPNQSRARASIAGRPPSSGTSRMVELPQAPQLTEAQHASARKKLAAGIRKLKLKVVTLQDVPYDELFTMSSLSLADLYHMGRGVYAKMKVGISQTNEDARDEECQTDSVNTKSYGNQAPEDKSAATGLMSSAATDGMDSELMSMFAAENEIALAAEKITKMEPGLELKMNAFIMWAGPMVLAALGVAPSEKHVAFQSSVNHNSSAGSGLTGGLIPLAQKELLGNRPVTSLAFMPVSTGAEPLLLVSYGPVGAQLGSEALLKEHSLAGMGLLCVWDLSAPESPKHVLVSEGSPNCCGFAPSPSTNVVYAGMEEGGVYLWDLEESAARHPTHQVGSQTIVVRRPSYTTDYLADMTTSGAPIVSVVAVPRTGSRATPCYLYSLSSWGNVSVWTLTITGRNEGSDMDLGMRVGSCVRLVRLAANVKLGLSALKTKDAKVEVKGLDASVQASAIQALPQLPRQFLVAADAGKILKGSWAGVAAPPKELLAHDHLSAAILEGAGRLRVPSKVTAVHLSPLCPWAVLSGHDDGTVAIHGLASSTAALIWPSCVGGAVKFVKWSPSRPCVFFVLDSLCTVSVFDLAKGSEGRFGPVHTQSFLSTDSLAMSLEVGTLHQPGEAGDQLPAFSVGFDDGRVDVFSFAKAWLASPTSLEAELKELVGVVGNAPSTATTSDDEVPQARSKANTPAKKSPLTRNSIIPEADEDGDE